MKKKKELFQKWFQKENLLILILGGVLLFIIGLPIKGEEKKGGIRQQNTENLSQQSVEQDSVLLTADAYCSNMEKKLEKTLSEMSAVGPVKVMITMKNTQEQVLEKDVTQSDSQTSENDSQGGNRVISQEQREETVIYQEGINGQEPYVKKTLYPTVEGVLVVAKGCDSGRNKREITEVVCALFGIEAHKVKVVKMDSGD